MRTKEEKKNWLSCHALEKFELGLNENQESQVKNVDKMMKKLYKHKSFELKKKEKNKDWLSCHALEKFD